MRFVSPLLLAALLAAAPEAAAQDASRVAVQAETAALTSADAAQGDILGYDVALSGDRALLGATAADPAGESSGAAYVFHRTEAGWAEEAKLVPDDAAAGDYFGVAVALDADRALVGGTHHDGQRGAAYVFQRTASGWALDATLAAPGAEAGDGFGWSVDLSDTHVAVGAYGRDSGRGAAYVFDAATGALARTFTAPDADAGDNLGIGVALDGDRLVAGAPFDDQAGDDAGAAYVFPLDGGAPTKLTSPEGAAGDYFGWSVATRGGRALVG
ncbi:MAG: hypothetical protein AAF845_12910, partial [Bacteroidota bacterium]